MNRVAEAACITLSMPRRMHGVIGKRRNGMFNRSIRVAPRVSRPYRTGPVFILERWCGLWEHIRR